MVFKGGPFDGREHEPEEGFPAPSVALYPEGWPDAPQRYGQLHRYDRVETIEVDGGARHVYEYSGIEPR